MYTFCFLLVTLLLVACSTSHVHKTPEEIVAPYEDGKFQNLEPFEDKNFWSLLKWRFASSRAEWPKWVESVLYKPEHKRSDELVFTVINHASVLIQMDGLNILTDPHYSERTSPVSFAGPKRVRKPGILFEDLPPIDLVLISHNHYDHLDLPTLKKLNDKHSPKFFVGLGNKALMKEAKIENIEEMDWWQSFSLKTLKITFVPAQHWSARSLFDKRETLWGGFYIDGSKKVYFAGDTGYGKFFKLIKSKLGAPELSLMPIGAYEPRWFMKNAHMNPEEAVRASIDLESKKSVGIHFATFQLTDEAYGQPIEDLNSALKASPLSQEDFIIPEFGRAYRL